MEPASHGRQFLRRPEIGRRDEFDGVGFRPSVTAVTAAGSPLQLGLIPAPYLISTGDCLLTYEVRLVEWLDSSGSGSRWTPIEEVADSRVAQCSSVGYVLREDADHLVLMQSFDGTNEAVDNWIAIPKFAITKQATLRKASALVRLLH